MRALLWVLLPPQETSQGGAAPGDGELQGAAGLDCLGHGDDLRGDGGVILKPFIPRLCSTPQMVHR